MIEKKDQPNIGILTFPIASDAGIHPISDLIDIFRPLSGHLHLIIGNTGYALFKENREIHTYKIEHRKGTNPFTRVVNYIWTQLKISLRLMKLRRNVDFYVFFIESQHLLIPMLTAKLLRKNVVLVLVASSSEISKAQKDMFSKFLKFLEQINHIFSDRILIFSERLIEAYGLEKHRTKVLIVPLGFLDFGKFKVRKRLRERDDLVGYIGRLSEEKGILNFVRAIPKVLEMKEDVKFLIGGDGHLRGKIEEYLKKRDLNDKVKIVGWIPHRSIPKYLNELKLLVVPSYTEAGPLITFEAMACGTLVLGSQVGMMSEILRDGKNGFVLENNSPSSIAKNVLKILIREDLSKISWNARKTVEKNFTYDSSLKRYESIFNDLLVTNTSGIRKKRVELDKALSRRKRAIL